MLNKLKASLFADVVIFRSRLHYCPKLSCKNNDSYIYFPKLHFGCLQSP